MAHFEGNLISKLPNTGTTIFTTISALANKHNAINLSQGFPDFSCAPELIELVSKHMKLGHNQYSPMAGIMPLREKLAEKIESLYKAKLNPETEITITAGATQGLSIAISAFIGEDDEVIILEPAYDSYSPCIQLNKGRAIYYTMQAPDFAINWGNVQKLMNQRTKMIIINTPHNPTASVLGKKDMEKLQRILEGTDIILLSDEVYEHIVFDDNEHQSVLAYPELRKRSICISSFGKTYHNTGWKVGYVTAPENLMTEFRKVFQFGMFSVVTPIQYAFAEILDKPDLYSELGAFYQKKRNFFVDAIKASNFKLLPSNGTYFQCADYSPIADQSDMEFTRWLTSKIGVAAIPLSPFYRNKDDNHIIRFCFAKKDETLKKAADLLCKI
ncbi:MAG: methionine aminotransferase [Bacteroidetes bacterium]|nr:methionine aminotransferase [Bacteroidota bacterium]